MEVLDEFRVNEKQYSKMTLRRAKWSSDSSSDIESSEKEEADYTMVKVEPHQRGEEDGINSNHGTVTNEGNNPSLDEGGEETPIQGVTEQESLQGNQEDLIQTDQQSSSAGVEVTTTSDDLLIHDMYSVFENEFHPPSQPDQVDSQSSNEGTSYEGYPRYQGYHWNQDREKWNKAPKLGRMDRETFRRLESDDRLVKFAARNILRYHKTDLIPRFPPDSKTEGWFLYSQVIDTIHNQTRVQHNRVDALMQANHSHILFYEKTGYPKLVAITISSAKKRLMRIVE